MYNRLYRHCARFASVLLALYCVAIPIAGCGAVAAERPNSASKPVTNLKPLRPNPFYLLPLTSVKPTGWMRRQLQVQAEGLTGHLDEFWPDVGPNSGWLGGTGESWERGPYYVDGLVPLAYLLDDAKLIAKSNQWINWTLTHQRPDGAIGPEKNKDWWPNMVMLKALTQYQEATGDPRVIPLMQRYFHYQAANLATRPLLEWAKYRWADEMVSVLWLYNRTGDRSLLDLAGTLQKQGHDWKGEFENFPFTQKTTQEQLGLGPGGHNNDVAMNAHGVNNAMALKTSAVWSEVSGADSDRQAAGDQLSELEEYHLLPNGMFSCDEHLAGRDPSRGTELCSVVEEQFSLEQLISVLGNPALGDRLEKIAYNALPATFSKDMWAHQYDQQPNQVEATLKQRDWSSNGPEANLFGVEPNFGCCTANMHQGWPKFVASLWMATGDGGLAAVAYGPSEVNSVVRNGVRVSIDEKTEYPFRGDVRLTVNPAIPAVFPLQLRIPAWAEGATIAVNGSEVAGVHAGEFHSVERKWKHGDQVVLSLPMRIRASQAYHNSVVIERGPLVFSLKMDEQWRKIDKGMSKPAAAPAADWEVESSSPWNYGLIINRERPAQSVEVTERSIGDFPFSSDGAPTELRVKGRRIPAWMLVKGSAGPLPVSPVTSDSSIETLTLIPYGSAKLRITAFPQLAE